ncbi:unnamed protein product, partial [Prorocentrum cordatum]
AVWAPRHAARGQRAAWGSRGASGHLASMALGPFVRVIAQVAMVAGGAVGKAVLEAYREAAAGRGAAAQAAAKMASRRRMRPDEARKVLDLESAGALTEAQVQERFDVLHKLNTPTEEFAGSPYLQSRIQAAHSVLLDEVARSPPKADDSKVE